MNVKVFPLLENECLFWDFLKRKGGHLNCDTRSKYHILCNNSCVSNVVVMPKWMSSSCFFIYSSFFFLCHAHNPFAPFILHAWDFFISTNKSPCTLTCLTMCFRHVVHYNNIKIINIVFSNLNHIGKVSRSWKILPFYNLPNYY